MTTAHYRHTQVGWLMLVALALPVGLLALFLATTQLWVPLGPVLAVLLVSTAVGIALTGFQAAFFRSSRSTLPRLSFFAWDSPPKR